MKYSLISKFVLFFVALAGVAIFFPKYASYGYYLALNGDQVDGFDLKLSSGFFFYENNHAANKYIIFHRDYNNIPLYIFPASRLNFAEYVKDGSITVHSKIGSCVIYIKDKPKKTLHIDYSGVVDGVFGVDFISDQQAKDFCTLFKTAN